MAFLDACLAAFPDFQRRPELFRGSRRMMRVGAGQSFVPVPIFVATALPLPGFGEGMQASDRGIAGGSGFSG
ncbi:MAG: hypothetical protein F4010_03335 [Cenarchaeum sp. SB0669_bin_11]|nr:hypothetical protein [Cenarchaeum sp. SB0669_bin_11]